MEAAEAHLSNGVVFHATVTFDEVEVGPDLPVDLLPRNPVSLSDEGYELLQVPVLVNHVLSSHLAVGVDETGALAAAQHLALLLSEELVAVGALVEVILFLLQKQLQFLHKESTDNLVFAFFQDVEAV